MLRQVAVSKFIQYSHWMYRCLEFPYPIFNKSRRFGKVIIPDEKVEIVISHAYQIIDEWQRESPGPNPYVVVRCFGDPPQRVYINPAFDYIERKQQRKDIARRYRLLRCVKELLKESPDIPVQGRRGNLMLEGQAPPFKERFFVCIEDSGEVAPGLYGHKLVNFFPRTE